HVDGHVVLGERGLCLGVAERLQLLGAARGEGLGEPREHEAALPDEVRELHGLQIGALEREVGSLVARLEVRRLRRGQRREDHPRQTDSHERLQFTLRWPFQYLSRSRNFWSFPVAVRGSASRNSTEVGHLKCARCSRAKAISSASLSFVPG